MATIDPMHRMPQIDFPTDPHRYAANTSFSYSFRKNILRSAFRTSMLRSFQLIYCFFSKIFHISLLKSTDLLGIVQIDRHGLLLFLFCGDSKIEPMPVFFKLVFLLLPFFPSIPVRNRRRTSFSLSTESPAEDFSRFQKAAGDLIQTQPIPGTWHQRTFGGSQVG